MKTLKMIPMIQKLALGLLIMSASLIGTARSASASAQPLYAFGRDALGNEHCYPADSNGNLLLNRLPVNDSFCGTFYAFGTDAQGNGYCYPADSSKNVLVGQAAVALSYCGIFYGYDYDAAGVRRCYPASDHGVVLQGQAPVDLQHCELR